MPPSTPITSNNGARTAKNDGVSTSITGDKTRDKCIEMLYDALALESGFRTFSFVHFLAPFPALLT
jgi:transcription elongation factor S-II